MSRNRNLGTWVVVASLALIAQTLSACSSAGPVQDRISAKAFQAVPRVSVLDVMRASIETAAAGIGGVQSAERLSDAEWLLVEQDAVNLAASAAWVAVPGVGPKDASWVANPDWQAWSLELQATALEVREAARAKNLVKLATSGDRLQEVCVACHTKYRPATPSDGIVRYPFYPIRDLPK